MLGERERRNIICHGTHSHKLRKFHLESQEQSKEIKEILRINRIENRGQPDQNNDEGNFSFPLRPTI